MIPQYIKEHGLVFHSDQYICSPRLPNPMQLFYFLSLFATVLAEQLIEPIIIKSGTIYQYSSLYVYLNHIKPLSGTRLLLILKDDGSIFDYNTGDYLHIQHNGFMDLLPKPFTKGFSIKDGYLAHDLIEAFGVEDGKLAFKRSGSAFLPVALKVLHE